MFVNVRLACKAVFRQFRPNTNVEGVGNSYVGLQSKLKQNMFLRIAVANLSIVVTKELS